MIISRTPFRISFFGGGTDFPDFYRRHGGAVLLATMDKYCYLSVHELSPFFRYRFRASYARTELVNDPGDFQHPLIRECLLMLGIETGVEIVHIADLPGRTGLGTSSSFTVGLLNSLHRFRGESVGPEQLAREAIVVERERVGDAGGHQDQYAAAFGGFLRIDFHRDGRVAVRPAPVAHDTTAELAERLLLFYLGTEQSAQDILRRQTASVSRNEETLRRMLQMVDTAEGLLRRGDLDGFGDLLHETWTAKKGLAAGITNPAIDEAYEEARAAGARGGKILGAGGRGFLLLYARPEDRERVRSRLNRLLEVDFSFSYSGSRIIFNTDSAGRH
ncbi:MAG: kinase [Verrucomicrobia bacterium]|nr:MAG: kinase [Verrucomicrobiota bacterium]